MLKKLLKYDTAAVYKIWMILAIVVVGMSLVTALVIRTAVETMPVDNMEPVAAMSTMLATLMGGIMILCYAGFLVVTPILCYIRYYSNFFSDEGYLTFTLPISRKDLYLSKTINTLMFGVGNFLVTVVVILLMMLIIPPSTEGAVIINPVAFTWLGEVLSSAWQAAGAWVLVYIVLALVLFLLFEIYHIGLIQLCITIGATVAKKHKLLAAIGIYMGVSTVMSFFSQFFTLFSVESVAGLMALIETRPAGLVHPAILLCMLLVAVILATIGSIMHLVTLNTIERKLNLA